MNKDEFKQRLGKELSESRANASKKLERYRKSGRYSKAHAFWEGFMCGMNHAEITAWDCLEETECSYCHSTVGHCENCPNDEAPTQPEQKERGE